MDLTKLSAGLVVFGNAAMVAVMVLWSLNWTDLEKGAAYLVVNTTVAVGVSAYAHFRPTEPRYPVAFSVSFIAWTSSVFGLLTVFDLLGMTDQKAIVLQDVIVSAIALVSLFVVTKAVTPVKDAVARERQARDSWRRNPSAVPPDGHAQ